MGGLSATKVNNKFDHLVKKHPCFSGDAHFKFGRIHLPVSPNCNIQCKFCKRSFNKYENRPGVASALLTPDKAVDTVRRALELCPDITVVGIAGPGDTLATDHAIEAFEKIHEQIPNLINCLSTNGLLLKEKAQRVINAGVKTITVTVNAVDPEILTNICSNIVYKGQHLIGREAANLLIEKQIEGIREAAALGAVIKINVVLIPGVNDHHVGEIARVTSELGASLINIIPLIPQNDMEHLPAPDCQELHTAREAAEEYLPVFRHCKHCRADACGIPGLENDLSGQLYDQPIETFSHG